MENKHSSYDLTQMQSLPLELKIRMTQRRIREWYDYWDGNVYVSFSGGKDSTVLLHIVRGMYPDVPAVFVDTGLEFPEIKAFVKTFDNVIILRPKISFKQVIEKYGYPVASKEIAKKIESYRNSGYSGYAKKYVEGYSVDPSGNPSSYNISKRWRRLIYAPFKVSSQCCNVMKKKPAHDYARATGRNPYIGMLADESLLRKQQWERYGCNAFDSKNPSSNPLSFWTEQDILAYIRLTNIPIASPYGKIAGEGGKLYLTGRKRTGCVFCMFGAHLDGKPNRFEQLKKTHPQLWVYCMKPKDKGGLGLKAVCDYCDIRTGAEDKG